MIEGWKDALTREARAASQERPQYRNAAVTPDAIPELWRASQERPQPDTDDAQRRCWTILGPEPISQCVFFNGHEGEHWFGSTKGRWVPEGEACCSLAAQVIHVQSQGGKVHIGLGERCEDNVSVEPDGTDAGALASILDETKGGPWKPDDGTSLWFYNEAGDQIRLTGDDVVLLLESSHRASQERPSIDVERLARAVEIVGGKSFDLRASRRDIELVAAEYQRLSGPVGE